MIIYTHEYVDLDAAASVWAAMKFFVRPGEEVEIKFVPANWDGAEMGEDDLALDIAAGGRGRKGRRHRDGSIGSCFADFVALFAYPAEQAALRHLVAFVEAQDTHGQAVEWLASEASSESRAVLAATSLNALLCGFKELFRDEEHNADRRVIEAMMPLLDAILADGRARCRAVEDADRAELFGAGRVALVRDPREFATNAILFERGVEVIVFADGYNIGVIRRDGVPLRMDHPAFRAVVEAAGEEVGDGDGKWFAHRSGFIFVRGTRKARAGSPSRVRPEDLAMTAVRLLDADPRDCSNCDWPDGPMSTDCS